MATGWINLNGSWYYLKDSGNMSTGWVTSNGASYYLDASTGRMLTNTTIEGYKIGSDGKKQTSPSQSDADTNNSGTNKPSNSKKTIVIDPGYNYCGDVGAVSTIDGVTYSETELNMQVASKLKTELENRGAKDSALKVCINTKMPAVLVEVGFITNKEEAARCANSSNQQNVAEAISKNFK